MSIHGLHGRTIAEEYDYLADQVEAAHAIGEHHENANYTVVYVPIWKQMIVLALREAAQKTALGAGK